MRVLVMMSDNRPLDGLNYNSLSVCINNNYCLVNNYDFIYYQPYYNEIDLNQHTNCVDHNNELRHAAWSKLLSTLLAMEMEYDYIVYIDTDAVFKSTDYTIEHFIEKYMGDHDFLFMDNSPDIRVEAPEDKPCSGFFVAKVNDKTRQDIIDWYNVNTPEYNIGNYWEQSGLHTMMNTMNIKLIHEPHFMQANDYWSIMGMVNPTFGHLDQLISHVATHTYEIRVPYFTRMVNELGLDPLNNDKVNLVCYDTNPVIVKYFPLNRNISE